MARTRKLAVVPGGRQTPLERLVDDYLASCRASGVARGTLSAYEHPLRKVLLPWAAGAGVRDIAELDRGTLDRFAGELLDHNPITGRTLSRATVHSYLRPVRQLLKWAASEGETVRGSVKLPRLPHKTLDVFTLDELEALEGGASNERDALIVRVLAATGIRVGELVQLTAGDFRTKDRRYEMRVHGKGDRERIVPLTPDVFRRVERYAARTRPHSEAYDELFISLRRSPRGDYERLTPSGVEQMVRAAGMRAGIRDADARCHPHMLRHSFITNALRRGMSPMIVKQFAGHTSLRMIDQVYSHLTLADAHDELMRMVAADRKQPR